jgi:hypothetical protein
VQCRTACSDCTKEAGGLWHPLCSAKLCVESKAEHDNVWLCVFGGGGWRSDKYWETAAATMHGFHPVHPTARARPILDKLM